jgi:hypothetical protein
VKRVLGACGFFASLVYACSTGGGAPFDGEARGGSAQGASGGSEASGGRAGETGGRGGSSTIPISDASTDASDDVTLDPDAACGIGTARASLRPVSMFVMFDRSTSMVRAEPDPVTSLNRWQTAASALKAFFSDPSAEGLAVALRFFPDDRPEPGCVEVDCNAAACAEPLVDVGTLGAASAPDDAHEAALVEAVDTSTPMLPMAGEMAKGGTPISVALDGALAWASDHQREHADGRTVVLFVTDGQPAGCDERIASILLLAENALAEAGVATYAVGLTDSMGEGLQQEDMEALAVAGGTERAYFISDGPTAADELLETLSTIRGLALPCDFPMPEATTDGVDIDPGLVNVTYTSGDGADTQFTRVHTAEDCATSRSWYYDDPSTPSRIMLCPAACTLVSEDPHASFEILVGCAPIFDPPR